MIVNAMCEIHKKCLNWSVSIPVHMSTKKYLGPYLHLYICLQKVPWSTYVYRKVPWYISTPVHMSTKKCLAGQIGRQIALVWVLLCINF